MPGSASHSGGKHPALTSTQLCSHLPGIVIDDKYHVSYHHIDELYIMYHFIMFDELHIMYYVITFDELYIMYHVNRVL